MGPSSLSLQGISFQRQGMPNVETEPYSHSDDIGVLGFEDGVDFPQ